ncbi:MAG: Hint domain-containing protein [Paracoccaceae bacterium]
MTQPTDAQALSVHAARDITVTSGVAEGEAMGFADDLVLDDEYVLRPGAGTAVLSLTPRDRRLRVAEGSALGTPGNVVVLDSCVTLMSPGGVTEEALILVEVAQDHAAGVHVLPLGPLEAGVAYRLVGIDRRAATARYAASACAAFAAGTRVSRAGGEMVPVESLRAGDALMTRDGGPQKLRWVGRTTARAQGAFAPVRIAAGALSNDRDLLLSPEHRVLVHQRSEGLGGRGTVMVRVRHLIDGTRVVQEEGGFVDYVQLLFDAPQVVFAEGIAAETMQVDRRTLAGLPRALGDSVARAHIEAGAPAYELSARDAARDDALDVLRAAARGAA